MIPSAAGPSPAPICTTEILGSSAPGGHMSVDWEALVGCNEK